MRHKSKRNRSRRNRTAKRRGGSQRCSGTRCSETPRYNNENNIANSILGITNHNRDCTKNKLDESDLNYCCKHNKSSMTDDNKKKCKSINGSVGGKSRRRI